MQKRSYLPALAVAGGAAGFALRRWQFASALEPETQLFRPGAPATLALVALGAVLAVLFLLLVRGGNTPAEYAAAFRCPSTLYLTLMAAGSMLLLTASALGTLEFAQAFALWSQTRAMGQTGPQPPVMLLLAALLCVPAGLATLVLAKGNYRQALPSCHPGLATLPAYAALPWLVALYQEHSRDPVLLRFADMLLGVSFTALALYFMASFAFRRPRPRSCLFFSLLAVSFNLEALANRQSLFFTALTLAMVLCLIAQSGALTRNCFGPPRPACPPEERMPDAETAPDPTEDNQEDAEHG